MDIAQPYANLGYPREGRGGGSAEIADIARDPTPAGQVRPVWGADIAESEKRRIANGQIAKLAKIAD